MTKIEYTGASVVFPEYFGKKELKVEKGKFDLNNQVTFTHGNMEIEASLKPFYLPGELPKTKKEIQSEIIQPTKDVVLQDIEPCEELIQKLYELAKEGKHQYDFYFEKTDTGEFRLFDYCLPIEDQATKKLLALKIVPKDALKWLKPEYEQLAKLAKNVRQEKDTTYVVGSNLKEAFERALEIYGMAEQIREALS